MQLLSLVAIVFTACVVSAKHGHPKDRLAHDILKGYQPFVDPGNIELEFALAFTCARWESSSGTVVSNVWEQNFWKDSRLTWNPSEYGGIENIRLPSNLVWKPDTKIYNSASAVEERDDTNVVVYSDGRVLWIPTAKYRTFCTASETEVSCKLKVGSWTYDGYNLALKTHGKEPFDLANYDPACPAEITSHTAEVVSHKYPCCEEPYPSFDVTFKLKPRQGKFSVGKTEL